jgi:hypothetical protein
MGLEMLRISRCLDNWLTTDGGQVVSLKYRSPCTLQKKFQILSSTHICQRLSKYQGLLRLEV